MPKTASLLVKKRLADKGASASTFDLTQYGITVQDIQRNLSPALLYTEAIQGDVKCTIADTGAPIAFSGDKTGRSPTDKRVVEHSDSKQDVWWGAVNVPLDDDTLETNRERAVDYGTGARMKLKLTRAIINAIHSGELAKAKTAKDHVFGFAVPTDCSGVPAEILIPRNTWGDKASYDATARKLAGLFRDNFTKCADGASAEVCGAGPVAN